MTKAKTAINKKKVIAFYIQEKKVFPIKFVSEQGAFMAARYKDAGLVKDKDNSVMPWKKVTSIASIQYEYKK